MTAAVEVAGAYRLQMGWSFLQPGLGWRSPHYDTPTTIHSELEISLASGWASRFGRLRLAAGLQTGLLVFFDEVHFSFSEPVSAGAGAVKDLLLVVPPASGGGSCEWDSAQSPSASFGYFCRGFSETDTFAVSVADGLVGGDGTPVTTLAGQSSYQASLTGSATDCVSVQP